MTAPTFDTHRVPVPWLDRHLHIAQALQGGEALLAYAEQRGAIEEQRAFIVRGGKPVLAYASVFRQLGLTGSGFDSLKRFAGEVAAFVAETLLGAQRAPGTKAIAGHDVFSSAQPFRFPAGSQGRSLTVVENGEDAAAVATPNPPGTMRFLRMLEAILETAERHELPLARNMVEQVIARRPAIV
jgi:hypothetical protein